MTLTAMHPVLYRSHQYSAGDALPGDDAATVAAWLEAGSAAWLDEEASDQPAPKAFAAVAQPGRTGISSDGDPEALVGRVPARTAEAIKPQRKKTVKK